MKSDFISRSKAKKLGATCLARRNENGQLEAIISLDEAPISVKEEKMFSMESQAKLEHFKKGYEACKRARPQGIWGKWIISEVQCPHCFEYFDPDCYAKGELDKCPCCGTYLMGGAEQ